MYLLTKKGLTRLKTRTMISKMNEGAGDGTIAAADILQGERYDAASGDDIITKTGTYTCL